MKHPFSPIVLAICTTLCGLGSAYASSGTGSPPPPGFLAAHDSDPAEAAALDVQTVGDDVLAGQTGKYAGGTMISGFVLNVISQWQLPNGASALAQGTLTAAQTAAGQVATTVSTLARVTDGGAGNSGSSGSSGANPNAHATGGQNIAVNGVSQVTQVAGDRNAGANLAQIDFNNNAIALAGSGNAPSAAASNASGSVTAGISFGSNGVNLSLQTPAGLATQTIAPGNGQIAQLLQIAGNNQQVANQLQLHLQTQQMSPAMIRQIGVLQALQTMRR